MSALIIYSDENLVLLETEGKYHLHRELETWSYLVFYAFCDFWTTSERNIRTLKSPWIHSITNSKPKFAPLVCLLLLITAYRVHIYKKFRNFLARMALGSIRQQQMKWLKRCFVYHYTKLATWFSPIEVTDRKHIDLLWNPIYSMMWPRTSIGSR